MKRLFAITVLILGILSICLSGVPAQQPCDTCPPQFATQERVQHVPADARVLTIPGLGCHAVAVEGGYVTAAHCRQGGQRIGVDASFFRHDGFPSGFQATIGDPQPGPAVVHLRGDVFHEIHISLSAWQGGYIGWTGYTPTPGDSGAPIYQDGKLIAVVSFAVVRPRPGETTSGGSPVNGYRSPGDIIGGIGGISGNPIIGGILGGCQQIGGGCDRFLRRVLRRIRFRR